LRQDFNRIVRVTSIHFSVKPGGPFVNRLIAFGAVLIELLTLLARRAHVAHQLAPTDLFVNINAGHVIPHSFSQVYPEICAPSFLADARPLLRRLHLRLPADLGLLEQAVAFGGPAASGGRTLSRADSTRAPRSSICFSYVSADPTDRLPRDAPA
jgi:hypothetical protein